MERPTLQEQLDACRDAAQAASDPLLRELADALKSDPQISLLLEQQLAGDAPLKNQLAAIPIPPGLREQLSATFRQSVARNEQDRSRLRGVTHRLVDAAGEIDSSPKSVEIRKLGLSNKRRLPIRVFGAATTAAVALLLLVWMLVNPTRQVKLNSKEFASQALDLCVPDTAGSWKSIESGPAPPGNFDLTALPIAKGLAPLRWKRVDSSHSGTWVVWELESAIGDRIYVLTVEADWKPGLLPTVLSESPTLDNTANWSVGVFRNQGVSYAIIVEGGEQRFRSIIKSPNTAQLSLPHLGIEPKQAVRPLLLYVVAISTRRCG